jgi:ABC-type hemin transport system substrate-binding protein
MLDCEISLPGVKPYPAAPAPTVSKARVKLQGAVHQPDRRFDVLAKVTQHVAGMGKYARVVAGDVKGLPSEIDRFSPVCIPTVCPAAYIKLEVAPRG